MTSNKLPCGCLSTHVDGPSSWCAAHLAEYVERLWDESIVAAANARLPKSQPDRLTGKCRCKDIDCDCVQSHCGCRQSCVCRGGSVHGC